eukprot:SAG31_NODE_2502_length_5594_cov_3.175796_3_plen_110_part_00
MSEDENAAAIEKLVADLHEINPSTRAVPVSVSHSNFARTSGHHGSADLGTADDVDACWCVVGHLTSPAQFEEHDLPTSPNHTFRYYQRRCHRCLRLPLHYCSECAILTS